MAAPLSSAGEGGRLAGSGEAGAGKLETGDTGTGAGVVLPGELVPESSSLVPVAGGRWCRSRPRKSIPGGRRT